MRGAGNRAGRGFLLRPNRPAFHRTGVVFPNVAISGVVASISLVPPAGSVFSPLSADVVGAVATLTLRANPGSTGTALGIVAVLTLTAPAGGIEAFEIDRSDAGIQLTLLDDHVPYQPGVVRCSVIDLSTEPSQFEAWLFLDGQSSSGFQVDLDPDTGVNNSVVFPVDNLNVGGHTLTAGPLQNVRDSRTTQTFYVDSSQVATGAATPQYPPSVMTGNWTFQSYDFIDVMNILTYVFATNPTRLEESYAEPALTTEATTSYDGLLVTWEGERKPDRWTISGDVLDKYAHDALVYWANINQRLWVSDEFGRTILAKIVSLKMVRKRDMDRPWHHTYTMIFDVLDGPSIPAVDPSQYDTVFG